MQGPELHPSQQTRNMVLEDHKRAWELKKKTENTIMNNENKTIDA